MDPFLTSYFFAKGIAIGLVAAAPIGPVNILVMQQTLRHGRVNGLLTGLGAVLGDGVFATVAAFGISAVSTFILAWAFWIQILGATILCVMGVKTFRARPQIGSVDKDLTRWTQTIASTFALTVTNPMTMLGFAALFAGVGGVGAGDLASAASIVAGVVSGSALWWLIVSQGVGLIRSHIDDGVFQIINRVSGSMIIFFGLAMFIRLGLASPGP
jgi:threonine/homoserine/homoserine lactone efflux protein